MGKRESSVEKAVREAVVKTAGEIGKLKMKIRQKSGPAKEKVKEAARTISQMAAKEGMSAKAKAKKLSRKAVTTAKDAYKGFKEGIEQVRRKK
ncbi:MAG TPA: hypothetical protein DCX95_07555 [Elusimicrobia bacterium]|nr:hypothetical protein [Elusimicrobiota bacterium]